jgi:hypothetical protein
MLSKLLIAGTIAAAAAGVTVPAAASAHDYQRGYYGGHGYYRDGYRDWRPDRYRHHRWHNRWHSDRDWRWHRHHRDWRRHYRGDYYRY